MILTRQQKADLVIRLANQGKSTRHIAKAVHVSLKYIGTIIRRYTGEEEPDPETEKSMSINSRVFKFFKENKDLVNVAIILNIEAEEVLDLHYDYLRLSNKDRLMSLYREMGNEIHLLTRLYRELKWHGLANPHDMSNIFQQEEKLKNLDKVWYDTAEEVGRLNSTKMKLEKDIGERMKLIGVYDSMMMENGQETIC